MGKFENFKSEQELVGRIEQLRADGVNDNDITVFSNEALEGNSLNYTDVNFKSADGTAWDKFVSLFTSQKPEERAISDLGLSEENKQDYITALQAGDILLFVSEDAAGASEEKLGNNEEDTTNYQSDDDKVGGEPHDAEFKQEESDPGLAGTDRERAISNPVRDDVHVPQGERYDEDLQTEVDSSSVADTSKGDKVPGQTDNNPPSGRQGNEQSQSADRDNVRDEDLGRDARVVDEEPNHEYATNETAEAVDVSNYGYDDTANRDDIETASDGSEPLKDEDTTRDDRAIRNKYKFEEVRESEFTTHDPDRRNFNTD